MKARLIVRRLAETQLMEAYQWYEARAKGLGVEFLHSFEAACEHIERHPQSCPVVFMDFRRQLLRKFPYGVFFVLEGECRVVAAVFHLARNPRTIKSHLEP